MIIRPFPFLSHFDIASDTHSLESWGGARTNGCQWIEGGAAPLHTTLMREIKRDTVSRIARRVSFYRWCHSSFWSHCTSQFVYLPFLALCPSNFQVCSSRLREASILEGPEQPLRERQSCCSDTRTISSDANLSKDNLPLNGGGG